MANFTSQTITEANGARALIHWVDEARQRMVGADVIVGTNGAGRPIRLEGICSPPPDLSHPPMFAAADTIDATEKTKIANYMQAFLRWAKAIFAEFSVAETSAISVAGAAVNANVNTQLINTRAELIKVSDTYTNFLTATAGGNAAMTGIGTPQTLS